MGTYGALSDFFFFWQVGDVYCAVPICFLFFFLVFFSCFFLLHAFVYLIIVLFFFGFFMINLNTVHNY